MQMELSDAAVVAQILTGDREAFRVLVERHSRNIFKAVYRMTNNQEDADEIVQETFLRAYKSLARFQERSSFYTWIYRIAMNRTLDFLSARKPGRTLQISDSPEPEEDQIQLASTAPGPDRALLSRELKTNIAEAMQRLTPPEKIAFTLRHMEGRSIDDVSRALGIRKVAARNTVFRAIKKLRTALEPMVPITSREGSL
jgi:RNA polymerase sigma-70 factor (ECF subfamily)